MQPKLSDKEHDILEQIVWLAFQLPGPLTDYTRELGRLRQQLGVRSRTRGRKVGHPVVHDVRARDRWK